MPQEKSLMIKNLVPGLTETGKIKIGMKGKWVKSRSSGKEFQLPQKLDHFLITTMERDAESGNYLIDEDLHQTLGDPGFNALCEIPIRLLYNDIELNFQTRYSCYRGTQLLCYGDGTDAHALRKEGHREPVACPCQRQDPKYNGKEKCKINGTLSCIIDGAEIVGGVWKFRTTSFNSVVGLISSLTLIKRISGGYLAGLPLDLVIAPKTVSNPIDGKSQTVFVVNIEFVGTVQALRDQGFKYALEDKKHDLRIENLEAEAKRLLSPDAAGFNENAEDIRDEFYPQNEKGERLGEPGDTPDLKKPDPGPGPAEEPKPEKPKPDPGEKQAAQDPPPERARGRRGHPRSRREMPTDERITDPAPPKMEKPDEGSEPKTTQDQAPATHAQEIDIEIKKGTRKLPPYVSPLKDKPSQEKLDLF